jgi:hypothetical protein
MNKILHGFLAMTFVVGLGAFFPSASGAAPKPSGTLTVSRGRSRATFGRGQTDWEISGSYIGRPLER